MLYECSQRERRTRDIRRHSVQFVSQITAGNPQRGSSLRGACPPGRFGHAARYTSKLWEMFRRPPPLRPRANSDGRTAVVEKLREHCLIVHVNCTSQREHSPSSCAWSMANRANEAYFVRGFLCFALAHIVRAAHPICLECNSGRRQIMIEDTHLTTFFVAYFVTMIRSWK